MSVLWTDGEWGIELQRNSRLGRVYDDVLVSDGDFVDYPILIPTGNVIYDCPERIPQYVRDKVAEIMRARNPKLQSGA